MNMNERTHGSMAPSASTTAIHDMNMPHGTPSASATVVRHAQDHRREEMPLVGALGTERGDAPALHLHGKEDHAFPHKRRWRHRVHSARSGALPTRWPSATTAGAGEAFLRGFGSNQRMSNGATAHGVGVSTRWRIVETSVRLACATAGVNSPSEEDDGAPGPSVPRR